ncbi:hypothetical protein [uncultured Thomasclavelia sp.]|uniref:hypothetical protein n=1 Tax=uncultured Thomasclavelia sp. TaxID=3025759 RepID=UPI0025982735|nr:hypothetical protein [uncultured Thomasclavelia sp.]
MKNIKIDQFLKKVKMIVYFKDKCNLSNAAIAYIMDEEKDRIDLYYAYVDFFLFNRKCK